MINYLQFYAPLFIASILITVLITPPISRYALRQDIVDKPGFHKTHSESKPLLGGLAIFIGFTLSVLLFMTLSGKLFSILIGALVLVVVGLIDDLYNLKAPVKLAGQTVAAAVVVFSNISYYHLFIDTFGRFNIPGPVVLLMITGWIVLMINAINLIDGLDGLAAGTAAIIFTAMAAITLINGASSSILGLQIIGVGACLGFLYFNFNPARIFMGDTGSMLLGYLLASTYLLSLNGSFTTALVLGSVFIFAYPALDVTFAIIRRIWGRKSIFTADKEHLHHVLINLGLSVRKTVVILYAVNVFFAAVAVVLLSMKLTSYQIFTIGTLTVICTAMLFSALNALSRQKGFKLIKCREELRQVGK